MISSERLVVFVLLIGVAYSSPSLRLLQVTGLRSNAVDCLRAAESWFFRSLVLLLLP